MKKIFLTVLAGTLSFASCEKDDICDANTPTTPQLVIEFYDNSNPTVLKNVSDLKVTGEGANDVLSFTGVSKIKLPLKTTADITKYQFVINGSDVNTKNEDQIEFDYSRKDEYISRACGFKTLFTLDANTPITLTDGTANDGLWIKNTAVLTSNIINENETHVKIYF